MELPLISSLLALVLISVDLCLAESSESQRTVEYYTDRCLNGKYHKDKPGPESDLFSQCTPWRNRSCCTEEISEDLHVQTKWYNFTWNHCNTPLSSSCEQWMRQDLCFYECSPNVGPWLVPHYISIRNELFLHVPLCDTDCSVWFEACRNDYTCLDNWSKGWDWSSGENECPANATCETFEAKFGNAKNMCENIWNKSYSVVPADTDACMTLWFDPTNGGNPNDQVALAKAQELVGDAARPGPQQYAIFTTAMATTTVLLATRWLHH
ncbi:folate receptor gamma-like [Lytechinus variegatus]|uniref:folate receptor gamma-like n=1 Tax=Lytechinus variegatus TaxID=7654 RepID=UPI001BB2998A|nr:folate receptor gamma-like [Lytechinus variegatus]